MMPSWMGILGLQALFPRFMVDAMGWLVIIVLEE